MMMMSQTQTFAGSTYNATCETLYVSRLTGCSQRPGSMGTGINLFYR